MIHKYEKDRRNRGGGEREKGESRRREDGGREREKEKEREERRNYKIWRMKRIKVRESKRETRVV